MKKYSGLLLLFLFAFTTLPGLAQKKPVVKKTTAAPFRLKTLLDSASYAIGTGEATFNKNQKGKPLNTLFVARAMKDVQTGKLSFASDQIMNERLQRLQNHKSADSLSYGTGLRLVLFFRQQGVSNLIPAMVARGIDDVQQKRKLLLSGETVNNVVMALLAKTAAENAKEAIAEGEKFLAENKNRPGVTTLPSGLQYEVVKLGDGVKPLLTDKVVCHYTGRFVNGNKFESSLDNGQPVTFGVNEVIAGWTEGLQLMPAGSTFIFYIPYQSGYGVFENGPIPGGSALIFEIQLIEIKK